MNFFDYKPTDFVGLIPSDCVIYVVVILLIISNTFMTLAWYNHLKSPSRTFFMSLCIAMFYVIFEYTFNIHANAIGYTKYDLYTLKVIQEAVTLSVFVAYAYLAYGEELTTKHGFAFGLVFAAVAIVSS